MDRISAAGVWPGPDVDRFQETTRRRRWSRRWLPFDDIDLESLRWRGH